VDLFEVYTELSNNGRQEPQLYLLFVGEGEEKPHIEERIKQLGRSSIKTLGFVNHPELPRFYNLCDVFALVSEHEPWGLV